jgi:hypothetical protein
MNPIREYMYSDQCVPQLIFAVPPQRHCFFEGEKEIEKVVFFYLVYEYDGYSAGQGFRYRFSGAQGA